MTLKRIELICDIPEGVTDEELNQFLLFKFQGHSIGGKTLDKFKHEELGVDSFKIEDY
ncbi:hypothetical protein MAELSTROM_6 [Pseudoalteromonas phage Maelstrom]|uniref:hypothetical protein n=1 Tax=Pseudoalteromonas phage Maelstrom TaxID=2065202 RepID=UPI000CA27889|nr:hypothetical protein PP584_gp06 [Pseudoalteromonas phage Maelstrom]AUG84926.1 hypothetical protein MAELSTROM_6 [Pseudoalteromonas phage Maelstrom]